jgi:hypothetical protein
MRNADGVLKKLLVTQNFVSKQYLDAKAVIKLLMNVSFTLRYIKGQSTQQRF